MPNPLDTLYDQLKGQYPDLVDRSEFIGKLSNEDELKKLHDAASKDIPGFVDFDNFKSKVGESLSTYDTDSDYKTQNAASTAQQSVPTDITIPRREKVRHEPPKPQNGGISNDTYVPVESGHPTDPHVDAEAFDRETGDLDELDRRYQEKVKRLEGYGADQGLYVNEGEARKHYEAYSKLLDEAEQDRLVYNRRVKAADDERAEQQRQLDLQSKDRKTRRSAEYGGYTNDQVRKEQERLKKERAYLEDPESKRKADYSRRVMEYNADQTALSGEADKRNKRAERKRAMYDEVKKVAEDPDVQKRITGNDTVAYVLSGNNPYALQGYDAARERAKTMTDEELADTCKTIAGQKYARGDDKDVYAQLAALFLAYHNELMYRLGGDEPKSALEMRYDMIDKATESSPEGDDFMVTLRNYLDGTAGMGTANFENDQSERANIPQFAVVDNFNALLAQKEAENMGKVEQISRYPQQGGITELNMAAAAMDYNYDAMLEQSFEQFGDENLKAYITAYALRNGISIDDAARRVNQSIWDGTIGKVMEDSRPKSNLEFFLRRITSDNMFAKLMQLSIRARNKTLGSTDAFMVNSTVLDEYAKDHPGWDTAAVVTNFAVMEGPIFSAYGKLAGGLVGAGERALIGAALKTTEKEAINKTVRALSQSLVYRLAKGVPIGGLVGFQYGTMSGAIDQAYYDGNVNFGKVIANGLHMGRDFAIMHGVGEVFGVTGDAILRRGQRAFRNGQGKFLNRLETASLDFLNNVAKTTTNAAVVTGLYAAIDKPALERENKKIAAENARLPEDQRKPLNQIASVEDTFYSSLRMFAGLDAVGTLRRAWGIGVRGDYERNKHVKIHFDKFDKEALETAFGKNPNSLLRQIVFGNVDGIPAKWFEIDPEAEREIYKELGRELTPAEKEAYATYGFTELRKVILNKEIPWATRAKIVSVITGRVVQEPPVAKGDIKFEMDSSGTQIKRIIVKSLDLEGNVIQITEFSGKEFEAARRLVESLNDRGWRNNAMLCGDLVIDAIEDKTYADTVDEMAREKGIAPDQFEQMVFGIKQKDITGEKVTYQERQLVDEFDKRHQEKQKAETELSGPSKLFEQIAREVFGADWKQAKEIPLKSWGEMTEAEKEFVNRYIDRMGAMGVAERNKLMNANPDWARTAKEYEESVRRRMAEAERPAEAEPLPALEDEKVSVETPAEERVEPTPEVIELEEEKPAEPEPVKEETPAEEPVAEEKPDTEEKPKQAGTIGFEPVEQPTERERFDAERKAKAATITDADIEANREALGIPEDTALSDEARQIYAEDLAEDLMRYERFKRGESDEKARFHDYWESKFNPKRPKLEKPAEKQEEPVEEEELEEEEVTDADALIEQFDNLKGKSDLEKYRHALKVFAGDDEIMGILEDLEPRDITEWVSSFLGLDSGKGYSMLWESKTRGGNVIAKGFKEETGWSWNDAKGFAFMFDNKNGMSPRRVAEKIWENLPSGMKDQYSDVEVFNIMMDLFKSSSRKSDLTNYIRNNRMEQVRELLNRRRSEELAEIARYKERMSRGEEEPVTEPVAPDESANEFVVHEDDVAPFSLLSLNYRGVKVEGGTVRSRARTRKQIGTIAKALGYKIRWVADKPYNAKIDTDEKVLYLNIRTDMPLEAVMGHEVTHDLRKNDPKAYETLKRYAKDLLGQEQWDNEVRDVTEDYNEEYKRRGWEPIRADKAEEEVVCDTMGKLLHSRKGLRELAGSLDPGVAGKVYRLMKDITDKVKNALGKEHDYSPMDSALQEFLKSVEQRAKKGIHIDPSGGYSVTDKAEIELLAPRMDGESEAAYSERIAEIGADEKAFVDGDGQFSLKREDTMRDNSVKYFEEYHVRGNKDRKYGPLRRNSITRQALDKANEMIAEMRDYIAPWYDREAGGNRYLPEEVYGLSTIFDNASYGATLENTLICTRTLAYNDFCDSVKRKLGRPLTKRESFLASQMLYDIATDPQCLYCYVSLDRKAYDEYLLRYFDERDAVIERYNKMADKSAENIDALYKMFLDGRKDTYQMRSRFNSWLMLADHDSAIGRDKVALSSDRKNALAQESDEEAAVRWRDITKQYNRLRGEEKKKFKESKQYLDALHAYLATEQGQIKDACAYAQGASWAKKEAEYRSYTGELLRTTKRMLGGLASHYGLRFYSFSEYSPAFILENMQMVRDAALRGLKGFAYTKEIDFCKIFLPTGININCSTYGRRNAAGEIVMDERQGANWDEARALRDQYENMGIVFVATDDEMVRWAKEQPWIDVIIPFHIVRTGADIAEFYGWTNYTNVSADYDAQGRHKDIMPPEHNNSIEDYDRLIAERGLTRRFPQFYDGPGDQNYMKLINETRRKASDTPILTPVFNMEEAKKSFDKFVEKGGYWGGFYEVGADDVVRAVDEVAADIEAGKSAGEVEYGRQDIDFDSAMANLEKTRRRINRNREHGNTPKTSFSLKARRMEEDKPSDHRARKERPYDLYRSDSPAAELMVSLLKPNKGDRILEPSAGKGDIIDFVGEDNPVTAVEINPLLIPALKEKVGNGEVVNEDFLNHDGGRKYPRIVMNPPFGDGGKLAIQHTEAAFGHLEDGGRLVAIIPSGKEATTMFNEMMGRLEQQGAHLAMRIDMPSSLFNKQNARLKTSVVVIDRNGESSEPIIEDLSSIKDKDELYNRFDDISRQYGSGLNLDNGQFSLKREKDEALFKRAKDFFGTTTDFREAGYILPDGSLLDFSGRHKLDTDVDDPSMRGRRTVDHRAVASVVDELMDADHSMADFIERGAIRINGMSMVNLAVKPTKEQATTLRRYLSGKHFALIDFGNGDTTEHYAAYGDDIDQFAPDIKPSRVLADIDRYFDEGIKPKGNIGFSLKREDRNAPTFYSNAAKAVENVKQNKATAEQWKSMLTKAGGIKAGEDKWMGLSTWLDEHKGQTLTKEEVAQFVADNGIKMEEVNYGENIKPASIEVIPETVDTKYTGYAEYAFPDYPEYTLKTRYEYPYGDVYDLYRNGERIAKSLDGKYKAVPIVEENARNESGTYPINEMRDRHTTNGLSNKREIVFTVPDVGSYEKDDFVHFGPENKGHQIMWVRFGETTDTEGNRVLVIDEVQSNRHQAARKVIGEDENGKPIRRGYKETYHKAEIDKQRNHINSIIDEINRRNEGKREVNVRELGMAHDEGLVTDKEYKLLSDEIKKFGEMIRSNNAPGIPAAPFESNWHEVAMKRMLRLAAEEGYDKVAWTTGKQQNDRYNLATYISKIEKERRNASTLTVDLTVRDTNGLISFDVDKDGIITHTYQNKYSETVGKPLADVIGKEVADEVLHSRKRTFNMDEMEIGGEGMKGFYDDMLPRFMDKYGKKWGVKTGTVELDLPNEGDRIMHSIDVTPEMKESVMQGQPLFSLKREDSQKVFDTAKRKFGETKDVREAGYVLPDGTMLDFSGRHELDPGTDSSFLAGRRTTDHRAINQISFVYDENGDEVDTGVSSDMPDFIKRGAIRIDNNAGLINLSTAPTSAQKKVLRQLIAENGGDVQVDFGDGWDSDHYVEYDQAKPTRVLGDIDRYFDEGIKPKGTAQFSLMGRRGAERLDALDNGRRIADLDVAEEMEKADKNARTIKLATGWERGADGKWRHEEPDGDFVDKGINVDYAEQHRLTLSDIWDSPELFKAYPEFAEIPVEIVNNPLGASATTRVDRSYEMPEFEVYEKFIRDYDQWLENTKKRRDQYKERLSSPDISEEQQEQLSSIIDNLSRDIADAPNRLARLKEIVADPDKIMYMKLYLNKAHLSKDGVISADAEFSGNNARQVVAHEIQHLIQETEGFASGGTTRDMTYGEYRRLAGETEARNVSRRVDMPEYERRRSLASDTEDVPRERQTVRYTSKTSDSRNTVDTYTDANGNEVYTETREDGTKDREITTYGDGSKKALWYDDAGVLKERLDYYPNGEVSQVANYDYAGELTRHIQYDENRRITSYYLPAIGTDWKLDEKGIARGRSNGVEIKPYNFQFSLKREQTHSENFKNWFGDWENDPENASKVVDADGKPLVVYRGGEKINIFEPDKASMMAMYGPAFYATPSYVDAQEFGKGRTGNADDVQAVYLDIRNPWVDGPCESLGYPKEATMEQARELVDLLTSKGLVDGGIILAKWNDGRVRSLLGALADAEYEGVERGRGEWWHASAIVQDALKELGYDGVVGRFDIGDGHMVEQVAAFEPTQIKSATENNGDFDPNNPDIRYSLKRRRNRDDYTDEDRADAAIVANTYLAQADALRQQIEADREREHQLVEERNKLLAFDYPAADPADRPVIMDRINALRNQINDLRNANYENNTKLRSMDYEYRVAKEILEQGAVTDEEAARFDAGQMTREEKVLESLFKAAADSRADKKAKQKAIRGLVRELTAITDNFKAAMKARGIESQRKHYDKGTVDHIIRLANAMMGTGYIDNMTSYEVKRLMGMINNAATRESIEEQAGRIVDMMLDHQIRTLRTDFDKQLRVTGQKTNSSGVQVQAGLDQEGQVVMEAMRKSMQIVADSAGERYDSNGYLTEWGEFYEKTLNDMGDADPVKAEQARKIFEGVWLASKWYEDVRTMEINGRILRSQMEDFKASNKPAKDADKDTKQRYADVLADYQEMLRQNKIKIIEAYERMTGDVGMTQAESVSRAKEFADKQKQRVNEIQHNANSDLADVDDNTQVETPESRVFGANKNNVLARLLFASAGTYEKFMRFFGRMAPNGEGYLFKRFMTQYHHARQDYWKGRHSAFEEMDKKMAEVFGKKKMHWSDIYEMTRDHKKFPSITVSYWDGYRNGQPYVRVDQLNQSEALYLYMINKMPDGRMKLRHMGITDDVVQDMASQIDNRLITLADWLQSEFLPKMRIKYNETHKRVFGADMAAIEDYFPLRINKLAVASDMDITERDMNDNKPSTITGAIVKRRVNTLPIDLHTDAFDVALSHIDEMEHWSAFAEFNRDNNTLVNYKRFRTKVNNMRSLELGAGNVLWKNFTDAVAIAADAYHPRAGSRSGDHYSTRVAKFVSTAKIALRPYTALKQLLSIPAFWADSDPLEQMKATVNVANTWQWAIENLPGFAERWQSRQAGNIKLANYNDLSGLRRRKNMRKLQRMGMWANAAIDGLACAMGGKAVYETKLKRYRKMGYDETRAQEKALIDAAIAYNNSQQSSEGAYVSPLQVDRTWFANAFSVFRSASMGYTRRMNTSLRQLRNAIFKPGYGAQSVEFLKKQMMRDGLTEEQATKWAHRIYRRANLKAAASVAIFGQILPFAWNLGANMFYLLFGDNDKEKEGILADSFRHSFFGPVEGLTGGNVISELGDIAADTAIGNIWGDGIWGDSEAYKTLGYRDFSTMPLSSDLRNLLKYFARDEVKAANEVVNILFQVATGVNPQTITDWATAILDFSRSDMERRDIAMFVMRMLSTPQQQLDKFYLDQMNISQEQASKMSVDDLIKRYATYKRWRETPLTGWMYSDEREKKVEEKFQKRYEEMLEERSVAEEGLRGTINEMTDLPRKRTMMQKLQKELTDSIEAADPELYKKALEGEKADDDEYVRHVTDKDVEQMAELTMKKKALRAARDRKVQADKDAEAGRITQEEYDAIYKECAHQWKLYNYLNNTLPKKLKEWKLKMEPDMQDKYTPEQVMDTIRSKTDKALQMRPEDMKLKKGDKKKVKRNKKK